MVNVSDDIIEILNALGLAENENPERQKRIEELRERVREKGRKIEELKRKKDVGGYIMNIGDLDISAIRGE